MLLPLRGVTTLGHGEGTEKVPNLKSIFFYIRPPIRGYVRNFNSQRDILSLKRVFQYPRHGRGKGSAGDKFRVIGMQETVEGAGANEVNGVLSEASCCRCGAPLIKIEEADPF